MRPILIGLLLCSLLGCSNGPVARHSAWPDRQVRQLVLVLTPDWDASSGQLQHFERVGEGRWQPLGSPTRVSVGRAGSAWGLGLHPAQPGTQKREGDGRAPAGVFALGPAFGYAPTDRTRMPWLALEATDWCIDVPGSPYYNRLVDRREVGEQAIAGSSEPMRRDIHLNGDQRYRQGVVIEHNAGGIDGAGSCIFVHLWQTPGQPTAGCTAMDEGTMRALLDWLDPAARPRLVLLPQIEYDRLRSAWELP